MLDIKLLKKIGEECLTFDDGTWETDTFSFYLKLPETLKEYYKYLLDNSDGTIDDIKWIESVFVEYWNDDNSYHYIFTFKDESVSVTNDFNCDYINKMVLEKFNNLKLMNK